MACEPHLSLNFQNLPAYESEILIRIDYNFYITIIHLEAGALLYNSFFNNKRPEIFRGGKYFFNTTSND